MTVKISAVLLALFLAAVNVSFYTCSNIEVFDIRQEKVVKSIKPDYEIQKEAKKLLEGIDGFYLKIKPIPEEGFMVKIPLSPRISLKNRWIDQTIDQVIFIFPQAEAPYLMVFENSKPLFLTFRGKTATLLRKLGVQ